MRASAGIAALVGLVFLMLAAPSLMAAGSQQQTPGPLVNDADALFSAGHIWREFLAAARAQRPRWQKLASRAHPPADLVQRFRAAGKGLRLVIVAEDWCPDSVEVVPYVVAMADSAGVPVRLVDRRQGASLMQQFRTSDGRPATPTIALVRAGVAVAAWVERPALVQQWFYAMATSPEAAKQFETRQEWFDRDGGRTALSELTELAERSVK